jgi:xanthine dehydrogenase accessory factor
VPSVRSVCVPRPGGRIASVAARAAEEEGMHDILPEVERWLGEGKSIAVATIIKTWGSAPRVIGSKMAVNGDGAMAGSVSGGCVESAVVQEALGVLKSGQPKRLHYGVADATAWEVGLACGGQIELWVEPLAAWLDRSAKEGPSVFEVVVRALRDERPVVRAVVLRRGDLPGNSSAVFPWGAEPVGSLPDGLWEQTQAEAQRLLAGGVSETRVDTVKGEQIEVFYDLVLPAPTLVISGGVHIGIELARQAKLLGFRVVVIDPRRAFGNAERFPMADAVLQVWPAEALASVGLSPSVAVAAVSHDPKIDDPALIAALRSPAFYIGALGSAETNRQRAARLKGAGITEEELSRLRAPIGLDLGGRAPAEIALAVMAEIIATRAGSRLAARP